MKTQYRFKTSLLAFSLGFGFLMASHAAEKQYLLGEHVQYSVMATNGLTLGALFEIQTVTAQKPLTLIFRLPEKYIPKGNDPNGKPLGKYGLVYEPQAEYFTRFTLWDAQNRPVPKTALGTSYQLKAIPSWDKKYMQRLHMTHSPISPIFVNDVWSEDFRRLPCAADLFEIKKPGDYRLVLEMQVFSFIGTNKEIVRFPPLEIPVSQPGETNSMTNVSNVQTNSPIK